MDDNEFDCDDADPMPVGATRPVLELVLLAIIEGHFGTSDPQQNLKRLRDAIKALTGKQIFESPLMDRERHSIGRLAAKVRNQSYRKSLSKLSRATGANEDDESETSATRLSQEVIAEERKKRVADLDNADLSLAKAIVEKYTGTYYKKQRRDSTGALSKQNFTHKWQHSIFEHDYVAESIESQIVDRILKELGNCGVRYRR